jgi:FkbM family methyltransferase
MRFLFIAKQKKNVDTFETTIAELLARGHHVTLAVQQRDSERDRRLAERLASRDFSQVACPEERGDAWRRVAPLVRSARDWAQYYQAPYARASKLHQRALARLQRELGSTAPLDITSLQLTAGGAARLRDALAQIEEAIPSDALHEEFVAAHAPDVVLVSPGLHFGSGQTDFIKSARALDVPVWMLLFSWDNLSTKGALHVAPDRMFVWNTRQVREAEELHGYPSSQVMVIGAPRFDEFFALRSVISRQEFLAPLQMDPDRKTILYLCSSRFIAADEPVFIREWLTNLRASDEAALRDCNVIVRPHPDVAFEPDRGEPQPVSWRALPQATGWTHRPFDDSRAVVLRTTYSTPQAFFECLRHADAIVALNTSAELEAGIVGRPVLTVLATGEAANGQAHTLHFDYLLREHGGFVRFSRDLASHTEELRAALDDSDHDRIRTFVMDFLRPHGDRPVAPLLADALIDALVPRDMHRPARGRGLVPESGTVQVGEPESQTELAAKRLTLGTDSGVSVLATAETRRFRQRGTLRVDPAVVGWLDIVTPGAVFYDVGAGVGTYSLLAAVKRGALAVAFEPGFAVYRTLCENVRLNDAAHGVVPLPIALGDQVGFFELEFAGPSGGDRHLLRNRAWRPRREAVDNRQGQPVCADRLDDVIARYRLPAPDAIRVSVTREAERILAGAASLLKRGPLRSVLVTLARPDQAGDLGKVLHAAGFRSTDLGGTDDFGYSTRFDREPQATISTWERLKASMRRGEKSRLHPGGQRGRPADRRKNST